MSAGFTLLEMLVVLAILGLVSTLATGAAPGASPGLELRRTEREIGDLLRQARLRAVARQRPVSVTIDAGRRVVEAPGIGRVELPPGAGLALTTVRDARLQGGVRRVRFFADGSASGGRIALSSGGARAEVNVHWLTGRVALGTAGL